MENMNAKKGQKNTEEDKSFSAELQERNEPTTDVTSISGQPGIQLPSQHAFVVVGMAFVIATMMVFGGAAVLFLYTAHKLQLHSTDDIRTKGRDVIQPGADILREQMIPLRTWAERMSRKWHFQQGKEAKERTIVKELSKAFGARTSN